MKTKGELTDAEALKEIKSLPDEEFNIFLERLPRRVSLLVKGRMVDWREVLPYWYKKWLEKDKEPLFYL